MSAGCATRFDHFEVPYDLIYKERVRQGKSARFLRRDRHSQPGPRQRQIARLRYRAEGQAARLHQDRRLQEPRAVRRIARTSPAAWASRESQEFEKFVNDGGVLITLGGASFFPAEFGITRTVDAARPSPQFYAPGPIVEAEIVKPTHPIFYGYTQKTVPVRYANGPLLRVSQEDRKWILMRFPGNDNSVLSGLMKGVAETRNRPAILDVPVGSGRVLLFATNPCYRWQNLGEFNMLVNSILHFNDFPKPAAANVAQAF